MLATERTLACCAVLVVLSVTMSSRSESPDANRSPTPRSRLLGGSAPPLSELGDDWHQLSTADARVVTPALDGPTGLDSASASERTFQVSPPPAYSSTLPEGGSISTRPDYPHSSDAPPAADSPLASSTTYNAAPIPPGMSGFRASVEADAQPWMAPYFARAAEQQGMARSMDGQMRPIPADYSPWWDDHVRRAQRDAALAVGVDWLVQSALANSPNIRAIETEPYIRHSVLLEESAQFDWRSFLESTYDDIDDPVGNTLTTGDNSDRFKDRNWYASGGFRRKNQLGGDFELSQQLGRQRNNSIFLVPNPQATARMELSYTQPLLNGAGKAYNNSRIVLARIDQNASRDEVVERLQDHLLKVTEAYWDLYRSRARYLQRIRLRDEAIKIANSLSEREQVDALHRQVLRANAAVARRQSEIARAHTNIKNAEAQLRLLVNGAELIQHATGELTPIDAPTLSEVAVSMSDSLSMALSNRPDISRAIRAMRSTMVRIGVARNEILPRLDVLVSTYVAGLQGQADVLTAWENQFNTGSPGFSVGLQFEVPIGTRAAKARYQRRNWEMVRAISEFQTTVETSLTDVELAVREVQTSFREMTGKYQAMAAAKDETGYLNDRFRTLPGANDSATLLLEDLLDSQERLADEEGAFVDAQVEYSTSLIRLRRAIGTLLTYQEVNADVSATQ